jgi:hypothetical protein
MLFSFLGCRSFVFGSCRYSLFLPLLALLVCVGCFRNEAREIRLRQMESFAEEDRTDTLMKAIKYLPLVKRIDRSTASREIVNQINVWSASREANLPWDRPELLSRLPNDLRENPLFARIGSTEFGEPECEYLLQCQIMNQLGRWVCEREYLDSLFAGWLDEKCSKSLSTDSGEKLRRTLKLFDWTVRNIALDGTGKDIEKLTTNPSLPLNDEALGYRMLPWQTLYVGHGDAWQRIRVFHQLLFQQGIPACILALPTDPKDASSPLQLWCSAVLIEGELYLFEPKWGLPFPEADQASIATLRSAKSNPNILRRAKLPGRFDYPVTAEDLKHLVALVDQEPFSAGRQMLELQNALAGDQRMEVYADLAKIEASIKKADSTLDVQAWSLPWLAQLYNESVRSRLNDRSPFSIAYGAAFGAYLDETPISDARSTHFKGEFETTIEKEGAAKKYMNVRIDEDSLSKLSYDQDIQKALQVKRGVNQSQEEFQFYVAQYQGFYRMAKLDSNAFLGMLQFDLKNWEASINWLDSRLLQIDGTERWRPQARYMLGRAFEQKGNDKEAMAWYRLDGSPQEAGNRIRVRLLELKASSLKPEL